MPNKPTQKQRKANGSRFTPNKQDQINGNEFTWLIWVILKFKRYLK